MIARFVSGDVHGIEGRIVEIEVDLVGTLHRFLVSGMGGKGIRESKERIRSAIENSGYKYPLGTAVVVNLAPATLEKDGAAFDLPIALGVLMANRQIDRVPTEGWGVIGELSLDGRVRGVHGVLGMMLSLRRAGIARVMVPLANLAEAQAVDGIAGVGVGTLSEAAAVLAGTAEGRSVVESPGEPRVATPLDYRDVVGLDRVKRALAIAVSGGHNVLLVGPPGTGKSFIAKRVLGLMPDLCRGDQLELTQIYSAVGMRVGCGLMRSRPFRAPHHTVSWAGLVGGGSIPRPGEITLAHHGVLFLDELPEFARRTLEALREPLEEGRITIARSRASVMFPARFLLIAAMNPCPCGYYGHPTRNCHCPAESMRRYLQRISGPLLDRIDMRIEVQSTSGRELLRRRIPSQQSTGELREMVGSAADYRSRNGRTGVNRDLLWSHRETWAPLSRVARELLVASSEQCQLSTRALTRVLRLARTIADVEQVESLEERHVQEALEFHSPRGGEGFFSFLGSM